MRKREGREGGGGNSSSASRYQCGIDLLPAFVYFLL